MNLFSKPKIYTYLKNFDFRTQWICSTSKILQRRRIFILHSIRATKIPIRKEEKIQCEKISEWPFWSFLRNTLLSALFYKKAISLWRTLCCRSWSCLLAFLKEIMNFFRLSQEIHHYQLYSIRQYHCRQHCVAGFHLTKNGSKTPVATAKWP